MSPTRRGKTTGSRARRGLHHLLFRLRELSRVDDKTWFVILVVGVGLLAALVSRSASAIAGLIQTVALGRSGPYLALVRGFEPAWLLAVIPALGGLAFGLIVHYGGRRDERTEGLPEIMEAVSLRGSGLLRLRPVAWKSLASLILNATGGSIGREGPVSQTAAALSSSLGRTMKLPGHRMRVLVGCGVAAGMATTYDAPVGAAFFAMEVIFGNFALDVFGPMVVASAVATVVAHPVLVSEPLFRVSEASVRSGWEVGAFLLVGGLGALGIQALNRSLAGMEWTFARIHLPAWLRVAAGGLAVGVLASIVPEVWGNGREVVDEILQGGMAIRLLVLLCAAKILATSISLGSGGAGGIFSPSLLVGGSLGSAFGLGFAALVPGQVGHSAAYAVAGMAGAMASLTHAPVTALLIVFDMTRDYMLLVPMMLASVAGAVVAGRCESRSIYAERLRRRGVDLDMAFEDLALGTLRASDLMRTAPPTVQGSETMPQLLKRFGEVHENQVIVVGEEHRPTGIIDLRDVVEYSQDVAAGQILLACDLARFVEPVTAATPLSEVMEKIWRLDSALLPVVDPAQSGRLVGAIARKDLLNAFDREMLRKRLMLTRFLVARGGETSIPEGRRQDDYVMIERAVPERLRGKSLAELDLPHDRHLLVVALRRGNGDQTREMMPPPANTPLEDGDRLILLGHRRDLEGFAL
jgi:CIC family chloride channel protein